MLQACYRFRCNCVPTDFVFLDSLIRLETYNILRQCLILNLINRFFGS